MFVQRWNIPEPNPALQLSLYCNFFIKLIHYSESFWFILDMKEIFIRDCLNIESILRLVHYSMVFVDVAKFQVQSDVIDLSSD